MLVPIITYELTSRFSDGTSDVVTTLRTPEAGKRLLPVVLAMIKTRDILTDATNVEIVPKHTTVEAESIRHAISQGYVIDYDSIDAALQQAA